MIAVLGALEEEVSWFIKNMEIQDTGSYNGRYVYSGYLEGFPCVVTWSGAGKVFAAAATQFLIDHYHPDILFFVGIAGGLSENLNIGDVAVADRVMMHDVDLSFFGFKRGELPSPVSGNSFGRRAAAGVIECDRTLLSAALSWKHSGFALRYGLIITGDSFIHSGNTPAYIKDTEGIAVDMEGAASALVCVDGGVSFFLSRVISDTPDGTVKKGFGKFLVNSSEKLYYLVSHIIRTKRDLSDDN